MSRAHPMSKRTITKLFLGSIVALGVGLALVGAAIWAAFASDIVVTVTLVLVGSLAMLAGAVAGVVSWIGALLNTAKLEDKTWFAALVVLSLFGLPVPAVLAYVIAGPDGTKEGAGNPPALPQLEPEV